jgi:hypothetical protein
VPQYGFEVVTSRAQMRARFPSGANVVLRRFAAEGTSDRLPVLKLEYTIW